MYKSFSMELAGRTLTVDVGRVAAQANGIMEIQPYYQPRQLLTSRVTVLISSR